MNKLYFKNRKPFLIIFRLIIIILVLELVLRINGNIFLATHSTHSNKGNLNNSFRIVCVGDSFTFGLGADKGYDYPSQLEIILKSKYPTRNMQVINKGLPGANSSMLLRTCERIARDYNPKMFIILVGANDTINMSDLNLACVPGANFYLKLDSFLSSSNVYKIFKYFIISISDKINSIKTGVIIPPKGVMVRNEVKTTGYNERTQLELNEINTFIRDREFTLAIPMLERLIDGGIQDPQIYSALGNAYRNFGKFKEAELILKRGIKQFPECDNLYSKMGNCLNSQQIYKEALVYLKKAVELDPLNQVALEELFNAYVRFDKYDADIENILKKNKNLSYLLSAKKNNRNLFNNLSKERDFFGKVILYNIKQATFKLRKYSVLPVFLTYPNKGFVDDKLEDFCQKENILFINIQEVFARQSRDIMSEDLFISDGHCNARGYRLMAEIIADRIDNYIRNSTN